MAVPQACAEQSYRPTRTLSGVREVRCPHPATRLALRPNDPDPVWEPVCEAHARLYARTRPLPASAE